MKKVNRIISIIFAILLTIACGLVFFGIIKLNVLPMKYLMIIIPVVLLLYILFVYLLLKKSKKMLIYIILTIILAAMSTGIYYEFSTLSFFNKIDNSEKFTEANYLVLVKSDSSYKTLNDIKALAIGILKEEVLGQEDALKVLEKYQLRKVEYMDNGLMFKALENNEINSVLLEESIYNLLCDTSEDFSSKYRVLSENRVIVEEQEELEEEQEKPKTENKEEAMEERNIAFDVSKANSQGAFNVYISGIDTSGSINSVARADVNMVVSVNPKTHKVLITHIPRDYYIYRYNTTWKKDKLAHVAYYGINSSVKTIEELLGIKIKYYAKVNFTSVTNIVDILGGIDVSSKYEFNSGGYHYNYGMNHLNGKQTLAFVRQRKAFNGGDRVRGSNQQLVLEAIINKCLSPSVLTNYNSLLTEVSDFVLTNVSTSEITKLINNQLSTNSKWSISSYNLNGKDSMNYTYSNPTDYSYVMEPDYNTVNTASSKIKNICYGK